MLKNEIKRTLIDSKLCLDNTYLDKYADIIYSSADNKREKFKTERHHVIPRFYFKYHGLRCDNSVKNIVNLTYANHIRAHVYLSLCVTTIFNRYASFAAGRVITGRQGMYPNLDAAVDIIDYETLGKFKELYNIERANHSRYLRQQISNKGRIWIYNAELNQSKLAVREDVDNYTASGWVVSRHFRHSLEAKLKNSEKHKGRKISAKSIQKGLLTKKANKASGKTKSHSLSDDAKQQISRTLVNHFKDHQQINKGKISVYTLKDKRNIYINRDKLDKYLRRGYIQGMAPTERREKNKKQIICLNTRQIFESASYVAKMLGVVDMSVTCKNFKTKKKHNSAKGHQWAYLEDWDELSQDDKKNILSKIPAKNCI